MGKSTKRFTVTAFYETLPTAAKQWGTQWQGSFDALGRQWEKWQAAGRRLWTRRHQLQKALAQQWSKWQPPLRHGVVVTGLWARAVANDAWTFTKLGLHRLTRRRLAINLMLLAVAGGIALGVTGYIVARTTYALYSADLTNPTILLNKKNTGTTILDRSGQVLYATYGANHRQMVGLSTLPKSLINATLAAEDPGFYQHPAFSWKATARAAYADLRSHTAVQGGSTITQQLVKNTLLTPQKSIVRKYQEILLAVQLERHYSKDQILNMYLNQVYYGEGAYGIESAAQTYFHKPASQLTLTESAMLAGLPLSPSRYDPNLAPDTALARRNYVLTQMHNNGFIAEAEAQTATTAPITASAQQITIRAPHFVFYVLDELRRVYGNEAVEHGGITVTTSLDLAKQTSAEQFINSQLQLIQAHHATNAGLAAVDPKTGDILAMVGSVNYNQPGFGSYNVTTGSLQPGSSWKPFEYMVAFAKGYNGATLVDDKPISYPQPGGAPYVPHDYDHKWRGPVTLRRALQNSLNVPAIHVLEKAGITDTVQTASAMGITGLNDASQYGLSLALGAANVRPLDMAVAYATIANHGVKVTPRAIIKVVDRFGADMTIAPKSPATKVIDPRVAYMITNILSDNQTRAEEFGLNNPLNLSRPAAAKTGTTEFFTDDWTIGYVPQLATAVWVGNNDHSAMNGLNGIMGAAPIWHNFMEASLAGVPVENFTAPAGIIVANVCADGGLADGPGTHPEIFLAEFPPTRHCGTGIPKPSDQPPTATSNQTVADKPKDHGQGH